MQVFNVFNNTTFSLPGVSAHAGVEPVGTFDVRLLFGHRYQFAPCRADRPFGLVRETNGLWLCSPHHRPFLYTIKHFL
jgi:hypothetical protein